MCVVGCREELKEVGHSDWTTRWLAKSSWCLGVRQQAVPPKHPKMCSFVMFCQEHHVDLSGDQ